MWSSSSTPATLTSSSIRSPVLRSAGFEAELLLRRARSGSARPGPSR